MSLVPFSNRNRVGEMFVTVDSQGRLCLSSGLRRELNAMNAEIELYASYDKINRRIGLAKPHIVRLTDTIPYKFDKTRGYAMARNFLKANAISYDQASRYVYDGKEGAGWMAFKLSGYEAPDQPEINEE